ncbi:MAG: twitch domain-containing radical SAM protein, partial [Pseudobdellovibrio sp.]
MKSSLIESISFCALPFANLSVGADGRSRVCCNVSQDFDKKELHISGSELSHLNSELHKEIRKSIVQNSRHAACSRCWETEAGGADSYRQIFNNLYKDKISPAVLNSLQDDGALGKTEYLYADLTLGNSCTLRCRMCHPHSSHLWVKEAQDLNLFNAANADLNSLLKLNWYSEAFSKKFIFENLMHIDRLNFLGGEPLIIEEHIEILESLVHSSRADSIDLQYNTNLTVLPEKLKLLWSRFKSVEINLSC